ncbi:hypothetical protein F5146DRAFT_1120128 [Armillaria mellea]|nr:hypothetical protein F5146DRAFT_1120128 [Armillaria mellea]
MSNAEEGLSSSNTSLPHSPAETVVSRTSSNLADEKQMNPWDGYENDEVPEKVQPRMKVALLAVSNLFIAILIRQELVINTLFAVACSVPQSWPFWIRKLAARVYHNGGVHSGAAVSGISSRRRLQLSCSQYIILAFLTSIVIFAHPTLRVKRHDTFERVHRFMGWTATALVWSQVVLLTNDHRGERTLGNALVHSAPFWLMIRSELLAHSSLGEIAEGPGSCSLTTHSFATIAIPEKTGFSIIISQAGDWSTEMITKPTRRRSGYGLRGAGIAPFTPHIMSGKVDHKLFWMAPNTRATFSDPLVDMVLENSPGAIVYGMIPFVTTRKHGKPDIIKLTHRLVDEFKPECVCVISNQKLTEKVIYGLRSRGMLAFGAIFDS